ncbi:MAG: permease [Arcobacteraceae bacterium]|nr:permease [Arcobacteraceae bacterium]
MKEFEFKGIKFLISIIIIYCILFIVDFEHSFMGFEKFLVIMWKLLPIFIFIIILTTMINYFLQPKKVMRYFGENSGKKGIFYMLVGGLLSHGPMYAWYGMLEDMRKHGLKDGLIVVFLYARAVKLPLLPFMIEIFGLLFTIVINIYILIFAILQGSIMNKILNKK